MEQYTIFNLDIPLELVCYTSIFFVLSAQKHFSWSCVNLLYGYDITYSLVKHLCCFLLFCDKEGDKNIFYKKKSQVADLFTKYS